MRAASIVVSRQPGFGATVVEGLTPVSAADADVAAAVRNALWDSGVVVIRQPARLEEHQARAIASMIGQSSHGGAARSSSVMMSKMFGDALEEVTVGL